MNQYKSKEYAGKSITYFLLIIWTLIVLFPIYWMIITSIKEQVDVSSGARFFPFIDFRPSLTTWKSLFFGGKDEIKIFAPFFNSTLLGVVSSIVAVFLGAFAAYGLIHFRYKFLNFRNKDISFWIISQRMLPPIVTVFPLFYLFRTLHLLDTRMGMIIVYTTFNLPFAVWIMQDFFKSIPSEIEESALVDGCSRVQIFFQIVLPLSAPGLVAAFILCMVFAWNEFFFALVFTYNKAQTMPLFIAGQVMPRGIDWSRISALSLLTIIPMIILALFVEKYMTSGLVKGFGK